MENPVSMQNKLVHDYIYNFKECLYNKTCIECGKNIDWVADFDADGTNYYSSCCEKQYVMVPALVQVKVYE